MKKIVSLLLCLTMLLTGCVKSQEMSDAQTFKTVYEELNGTIREKDGKEIRSITIPVDNPMKMSSAEEVLQKIENKDSFIVYFGFPSCPWCRSVIPTFLEVAKEKGIQQVYYVDVENIRDVLISGEEKEGTEAYYQLLEKLDSVLDPYTIDGKDMGEKRIYAPRFVRIRNGVAEELISGESSLQTDGYMELSEEMIQDMRNQYEQFMDRALASNDACEVEKEC
ncbi:MAG: thioredoxin family protein [Bacillota bacterium]|nr:thioredoxin family protein [Bacillota bacterium]